MDASLNLRRNHHPLQHWHRLPIQFQLRYRLRGDSYFRFRHPDVLRLVLKSMHYLIGWAYSFYLDQCFVHFGA